jgi:peptide/nickel transport system substrate-binding protein
MFMLKQTGWEIKFMEDNTKSNVPDEQALDSSNQSAQVKQSIPITHVDGSEDAVNNEPVEAEQPSIATAEDETTAEPVNEEPSEPSEPVSEEPLTTEEPEADTNHESAEPAAVPPPTKHHQSKMLKIIATAIIVLLVILAVVWLIFGMSNKKDSASTSKTYVADIALLRVGDVNGPIGVDTLYPNAPAAQLSLQIDFQVYEGLVGYKDQKLVPLLATSWTNPDSTTWVFKIKDGVKFQNGNTVTAKDVKASFDRQMKDEYWGQYTQTISSVTASGANEVTIKTSVPDSLLLNRLAYGFIAQENADKTLSGTGAYTVDTANSKAEDKTTIVAFNNYHQGRPKTHAVQFAIYKDSQSIIKDIQAGKADFVNTDTNPEVAASLAKSNFAAVSYDATGAYGLTLNMTKAGSPLQKLEVRQALNYAMDRVTLKKGQTASLPTTYIVPKSVVGFDESASFPSFDAAKVKELLTKAGYPNGVSLTYNYIKGIQDDALKDVDILNKNGFKVTARAYATPKEFVKATSSGDFDLFGGTFNSDLGDGLDIFAGLLSSKTSQFPSYNNPAFDKLLDEASQTFKPEEHVKKVQEINRFTKDNALWVPISIGGSTIYYHKSQNFVLDSVNGLAGGYFWKLGEVQTSTVTK